MTNVSGAGCGGGGGGGEDGGVIFGLDGTGSSGGVSLDPMGGISASTTVPED